MEHTALAGWENFYVIVGSSAAALTGLQFVVITLIAGEDDLRTGDAELGAFGTPTVVHFCAALLISVIASAPWPGIRSVAVALGLSGLAGVVYAAVILGRTRAQMNYKPVLEDMVWHVFLPLGAYSALLLASLVLVSAPRPSLFGVAFAALLLLFIGIRNAWDTVTWLAIQRQQRKPRASDKPQP
jgi:hypothetical protein